MVNETLKVLKERYSCPAFTDELPERKSLMLSCRQRLLRPAEQTASPGESLRSQTDR